MPPKIPTADNLAMLDPERSTSNYYNGLWKGVITYLDDPERRGRVRVRVYQLHEELADQDCPYAEPLFPYGGTQDVGFFFVPEVGSTVWIAFENAFYANPVWLGVYYHTPNGQPFVPTEVSDDYANKVGKVSVIKDTAGNVIILDATVPSVKVMTPGGLALVLDDSAGVTLQGASNSKITLDPSGNITIDSSAIARILGALVALGSGGVPVARMGDTVLIPSTASPGSPSTGIITGGSAKVVSE